MRSEQGNQYTFNTFTEKEDSPSGRLSKVENI